jgi:hypothetical protein
MRRGGGREQRKAIRCMSQRLRWDPSRNDAEAWICPRVLQRTATTECMDEKRTAAARGHTRKQALHRSSAARGEPESTHTHTHTHTLSHGCDAHHCNRGCLCCACKAALTIPAAADFILMGEARRRDEALFSVLGRRSIRNSQRHLQSEAKRIASTSWPVLGGSGLEPDGCG